eukprot:1988573-Rhodomonas_salina.1
MRRLFILPALLGASCAFLHAPLNARCSLNGRTLARIGACGRFVLRPGTDGERWSARKGSHCSFQRAVVDMEMKYPSLQAYHDDCGAALLKKWTEVCSYHERIGNTCERVADTFVFAACWGRPHRIAYGLELGGDGEIKEFARVIEDASGNQDSISGESLYKDEEEFQAVSDISLQACCAMLDTDLASSGSRSNSSATAGSDLLRLSPRKQVGSYAMSGTDLACCTACLCACYAVSGTELARMALPGERRVLPPHDEATCSFCSGLL